MDLVARENLQPNGSSFAELHVPLACIELVKVLLAIEPLQQLKTGTLSTCT